MFFQSVLILIVGAALFWVTGTAAMRTEAPRIERALAAEVGQVLREAGLPAEQVLVDGRHVYVVGELASEQTFTQVQALLANVDGVRQIERRSASTRQQPRVALRWTGSTLTAVGTLSADQPPGQLVNRLQQSLGGVSIVDSLTADEGVDRAFWIEPLPELMRIVWSEVQDGSLVLEGLSMTATGSVQDPNVRAELGELLAAAAPQMRVRNRIGVRPQTSAAEGRLREILADEPIRFQDRSDFLETTSLERLDRVVELLREFPDVRLVVTAYYDNGHPTVSLQRSRLRARIVRDYLLDQGALQSSVVARGRRRPEGQAPPTGSDSLPVDGEFSLVTLEFM